MTPSPRALFHPTYPLPDFLRAGVAQQGVPVKWVKMVWFSFVSSARVSALDYKLILSDKTFRAVFTQSVEVDFIVYAMNGPHYRRQVEQAISGADGMANNLPLSELKTFIFAVPPRLEARLIADQLTSETTKPNAWYPFL